MTYGIKANYLIQIYLSLWLIIIYLSDTAHIILYLPIFLISTWRIIFMTAEKRMWCLQQAYTKFAMTISYPLLHILTETHTAGKMIWTWEIWVKRNLTSHSFYDLIWTSYSWSHSSIEFNEQISHGRENLILQLLSVLKSFKKGNFSSERVRQTTSQGKSQEWL
jgi:hypothetical protein